jgi:hypothetical protein
MYKTYWMYTIRRGKLFISDRFLYRLRVDVGEVYPKGPTVYLEERNDELAKRILIEYEEKILVGLQEQIKRKTNIIKMLKAES